MDALITHKQNNQVKPKSWLKKMGWFGFAFFLVKGLVWLAIFLGVGKIIN